MSKPLQISADTAIKLSEQLGVPIEHLMHMPRHILLQKLAELAKSDTSAAPDSDQKS
jgi:plasmid maintenance system antidote protein VapI